MIRLEPNERENAVSLEDHEWFNDIDKDQDDEIESGSEKNNWNELFDLMELPITNNQVTPKINCKPTKIVSTIKCKRHRNDKNDDEDGEKTESLSNCDRCNDHQSEVIKEVLDIDDVCKLSPKVNNNNRNIESPFRSRRILDDDQDEESENEDYDLKHDRQKELENNNKRKKGILIMVNKVKNKRKRSRKQFEDNNTNVDKYEVEKMNPIKKTRMTINP